MHHYPESPRSVSFLRNEHRHKFKFRVYIQIFENDRDIEFILFQRLVKGILFKIPFNLRAKSCEMLADDLWNQIIKKYPDRRIKIEVSEDGENGTLKEYLPYKQRKENKNSRNHKFFI